MKKKIYIFDLFYHHANFHVLKSLNRFDLIFHFGLNCQLQNKINFLGHSYAFYYLNDHISWVHKVNSIIGKQLRAFYNGHFWHSKMTIWQNYDLWYHPPPWHHLSFWYHPPQMTPPWQHPTPWHLLPPWHSPPPRHHPPLKPSLLLTPLPIPMSGHWFGQTLLYLFNLIYNLGCGTSDGWTLHGWMDRHLVQ